MKHACKECWDPVDKDDDELCSWCQMTPEQRKARYERDLFLIALAMLVLVLVVCLAEGGAA